MPIEIKKEIELEIAHVLFIDIVGYSKLLIDEQRDYLHTLNKVVKKLVEPDKTKFRLCLRSNMQLE